MLNFIIYEDEEKFIEIYMNVIKKFLRDTTLAYRIIKITNYKEMENIRNLDGYNIFILDIEVPGKSGLDLAREIRRNGDWRSQIIISTSHEDLKNFDYQSSMLMLAFITKFYSMERELYKAIGRAYMILSSDECLSFEKDSKIYNIPERDILYFEKLKEETYSTIVTEKETYLTDKTLIKWEELLKKNPKYIKTHRNYLVNIYNIRKIDLEREEILLKNGNRILLSRNNKKQLKDVMIMIEESK